MDIGDKVTIKTGKAAKAETTGRFPIVCKYPNGTYMIDVEPELRGLGATIIGGDAKRGFKLNIYAYGELGLFKEWQLSLRL